MIEKIEADIGMFADIKIRAINKLKIFILLSMAIILNACSTIQYGVREDVKPIMAKYEVRESQLLNVSIKQFEPGELPKDEDDRRGLSEEIRNSEARYMPIHLKHTMQRTGYWGNVRVIPDDNEASEVIVKGKILNSDGEKIEIKIEVSDAANKKWFSKSYNETVSADQHKITEIEKKDRFQNLYNQISNDIIEKRLQIKSAEIKRIKEIAEIRFANFIAPEIFSSYMDKDKQGKIVLKKLPSQNDSMLIRVQAVKARDEMLVDTINNYYDIYYSEIWESYDNWRKYRSEELKTIRENENKALTQKLLGAAAIIGAIALSASKNSDVVERTDLLRTVMIAGGGYAVYSGIQTSKESEINKEAIEELGASFESEVEPVLIDVNGKTMVLTGTADQQYEKWRHLLKQIYVNETGFAE